MLIKAKTIITDNNPAIALDTANLDLLVGASVVVISTAGVAIAATSANHDIRVLGIVKGTGTAIRLGEGLDPGNSLVVEKTGIVQGGVLGVWVVGTGFSLVNEGWISGDTHGVYVVAGGGETCRIVNSGRISSDNNGISIEDLLPTARLVLNNSGEIFAGTDAGDHAINAFTNFVEGDILLTNTGTIRGDVVLGSGDNLYNGQKGRLFGDLFSGDGDDRFLPGAGAETFFADAGRDTLDFRAVGGVRVALDNNRPNTGHARGDRYVDIENILGSNRGNDDLLGSQADNRLIGNGGNDRLHGGIGGEDTLAGGAGRDTLTGGIFSDRFILNGPRDGADRITDFLGGSQPGEPFTDSIALNLRAFGLRETGQGGFKEAWFREGPTNQAQDRNDRFIFRTGDETLWFDADGKGGRGPVLIADLQDGAVLNAFNFDVL